MRRITNIRITKDYKIAISFDDGLRGEIDFEPFLQKGFATELLEKEKFNKVFIESGGGLAWDNGFDFCPNFLYDLATANTLENA